MTATYALYDDPADAQQAVDRLRAGGVADDDLTVISAAPIEGYDFSEIGRSSRLWYVAGGGGLIGMLVGIWLPRFTQEAWVLPTGNMAVAPWWTNLIIAFELTMLGAVLATVGTLIVTAGLGRRVPVLYDAEVSRGKILVGVEDPRRLTKADLERLLGFRPDIDVRTRTTADRERRAWNRHR